MLEFCNQLLNLNLVQNFRLELFEKVFFFSNLIIPSAKQNEKKSFILKNNTTTFRWWWRWAVSKCSDLLLKLDHLSVPLLHRLVHLLHCFLERLVLLNYCFPVLSQFVHVCRHHVAHLFPLSLHVCFKLFFQASPVLLLFDPQKLHLQKSDIIFLIANTSR